MQKNIRAIAATSIMLAVSTIFITSYASEVTGSLNTGNESASSGTGISGTVCTDGVATADGCIVAATISGTGLTSTGDLTTVTTVGVSDTSILGTSIDLSGTGSSDSSLFTSLSSNTGVTTANITTPVDLSSVSVWSSTVTVTTAVKLDVAPAGTEMVSTGSSSMKVVIPGDITIFAPAGWDGVLSPVVKLSSDSGTLPSGYSNVDTSALVQFGGNVPLLFDSPIKVVIPNLTLSSTKLPAYRSTGSANWTVISTACTMGASLPTNLSLTSGSAKECYVQSGSDVHIWTLHTTSFSALTTTSSSGGGSGGGGGGGAWSSTTTTATVSTSNSGTTATGMTSDKSTETMVSAVPVALTANDLKFTDLSGNWAKSYVETLALRGVVNNAQEYRPEGNLTRAEFLKIVGNSSGWKLGSTASSFTDVKSTDWYASYVAYAVSKGIISSGSKFRPNDTITRAEVAKILIGALGKTPSASKSSSFLDVSVTNSLFAFIQAAKENGIFEGQKFGNSLIFRPNDSITRAEIAKVVVKAMGF